MTILTTLFFAVLFFIIGALMLSSHFKLVQKQQRCTAQTTGKVIRVRTTTSRRPNNSIRTTYYYPVFQYTVNGCEYTITSSVGSNNAKRHPLHSYTTVYYDPASPEIACIKDGNPILTIGVTFLAVAIFFFVLTIFLFKMNIV